MIICPLVKKIPGELPKTPQEKYIKDLTKLEKIQLLEIKEREEKLLAKKSQILKLPDKGKRINEFYEKILLELSNRDDIEKAANLFSELNITSTGQSKLNILEWTGKLQSLSEEHDQFLESDDDENEIDPLKIIAQSRNLLKTVKYEKPDVPLITTADIKEIESFSEEHSEKTDIKIVSINDIKENSTSIERNLVNGSVSSQAESNNSQEIEPCSLYLFEKEIIKLPLKEKFMPYKTTKSNIHNPDKEKLRKIGGKYWEITAATPPPIRNSGTKLLSLSDSVDIQIDYLKKLNKLQEEQAVERLAARKKRIADSQIMLPEESITKVNKFFDSYRNPNNSDSEESDEVECVDEEDAKGGFITYTVYE